MNAKLRWAILLGLITFFDYGCTTTQRQALMMEAAELVESKVNERLEAEEKQKLQELDHQLAQFKTVDPETGIENVRTWKDFDADKNNELAPLELAKVGAYITAEIAKKSASGELSKGETERIAKGTGTTLMALLLILLGKRGMSKIVSKKTNGSQPANPAQLNG